MTRPTLIIMTKAPAAGRVKTRLGRHIGMTAAAWWYRHQLAGLLRRVGRDRRWRTVLAVSPDGAAGCWAAGLPVMPQGQGALGPRMLRALGAVGPGPRVLIGSDIPGVGASEISHAFNMLRGHDAVFGPATDGGYWLIGTTRPIAPDRLDAVRWSTEHALADSRAALSGLRIATAATLGDVDTISDLAPREIRASLPANPKRETA